MRIWRIRSDWETADLAQDAAELYNMSSTDVTEELIETVRSQYETDWQIWPWHKGAPFYDTNHNGIMDEGEEPGLLDADQVVWFVANDLDSAVTKELYGSSPIGMEMQVTLWAYHRTGTQADIAMQDTVFKRVLLIYKGTADTPDTAYIDSMSIGQFVDTDIGYTVDDLAGWDTLLQLGYGYNSTTLDPEFQQFNISSPAFGYTLIQGPIQKTNESLDIGNFNFQSCKGIINLPMKFFFYDFAGNIYSMPTVQNYRGTIQLFNILNGRLPRTSEPFLNPYSAKIVRYMFPGDPITNSGWIANFAGSHLFLFCSGPFEMALGDTQEVIIAMVGGSGADRLASISVMKYFVRWIRDLAQWNFYTPIADDVKTSVPSCFEMAQNYPNPFNSNTIIRYSLPKRSRVRLSLYNLVGQEISSRSIGIKEAGSHDVVLEASDIPSGIYFYRVETNHNKSLVKKLILIR